MQWFRLYNEFAFDPKIQTMSETFQRRFIMLLCLQNNNDLEKLTAEEIAFALRITPEELEETQKTFVKKGFIDDDFTVLNWDKRQYVSDNSTQRVRKHRQKQDETLQKRYETVTVTPPEQIQNRTEQNRSDKKRFSPPAVEEIKKYCIERKNNINPETFIDHYTSNGWMVGKNKMKDWKASVRTWEKKTPSTEYKDPYANAIGGESWT